ncbi:PREDICTED: uncharacterized protein LOC105452296 [Wasmannia auropunctata]|uniref:uncharacterized protein LOC105452296 n=1 Tax=Wasmannia auropunctata TaxID=64793 RepID=UPI0005EF99A1|nr:PREDICTED: uncharacterized protein LOC105452296 [Wasmannia auropunctata]
MWRRLYWTIALSCLVESQSRLSQVNDRSGEHLLADILSKVLQTSRANDALLILRDSLLDGQANGILGEIAAATARRVPTLYVNADRMKPEFQVSSWAMSRDLVVYIYVSGRGPDIVEGELVAEDTRRLVHDRTRPKVLVLMILHRPCRDLATLFRAMWSRKILDAIVVEYSKFECSDKWSTIVHRYNPFNDSHHEEPYSAGVAWFTDDFPNMQGYPFVYAFTRRPPYSDIVSTSNGPELKGVDKILSDVLAEKMNFTGVPKVIKKPIYFQIMPNGSQYGILPDLSFGKYDALLISLPMYGNLHNLRYAVQFAIQYTDPLFLENWCFVVPKLLAKQQNFMDGTAIRLLLMSFSIVGIFWLCSRLMKFDPRRWYFLRIVGIILAASFPPAPTKRHERIVFLSILAISASYSSIFFAGLTSTGFKSNRYVEFDHLQDLTNSDLVMVMQENVRDIVRLYNNVFERHIRQSGKKVLRISSTEICLMDLLMHQNVSCFMDENWAKLVAINNMRNDETVMKTTKLCYLSPPVGNVFPEGSPYVRRVSDLFLMLASTGLRDKWHHEYLRNETKRTKKKTFQARSSLLHRARRQTGHSRGTRPRRVFTRDLRREASFNITTRPPPRPPRTFVVVCCCGALIEDNVKNSRSSLDLGRSVKAKSSSHLVMTDSTTVVPVEGSSL